MAALSHAHAWLAQRFELSRGGGGANLMPMEGLRGLAVFMVFLVHYATLVAPWQSPSSAAGLGWAVARDVGNAGVDLFFVLSGYLIYGHLISAPTPFVRYMGRRIRRIYPAFLVMFAVYLLLNWLRPEESRLPAGGPAAAVYLLQNLLLLPGLWPIEPLITVAWSLSYEVFYYLVMPALIAVLGLRAWNGAQRVRFFALLGLALLAGFGLWGGPVRLVLFLAGVMLFELMRRWRSPGSAPGWAGLLLVVVVMGLPMPGFALQAVRISALCVGFFLLCFAALAQPHQSLGKAFCWWPLRWLGNMSYSYYLMHGLSLKVFFTLLGRLLPASADGGGNMGLVLLVPAFVVTLLASALLFLWIERPYSIVQAASSPRPLAVPAAG